MIAVLKNKEFLVFAALVFFFYFLVLKFPTEVAKENIQTDTQYAYVIK